MAEQTLKLTTSDVAKEAASLARSLWNAEFDKSPRASDPRFLKLVLICSWALQGKHTPDDIEAQIKKTFSDSAN